MRSANRMMALAALLGPGLLACQNEPQRAPSEDLTIVVEADRSKLSQEEERLRARQAAFEEERRQLREEKERLMAEKDQPADKVATKRLQDLERRLWEKERSMWERESALEKERQQLAQNKDELLAKAASTSGTGGTLADRERSLTSREAAVAQREKAQVERERTGASTGGGAAVAGRIDELGKRIEQLESSVRDLVRAVEAGNMRQPAIPRTAPAEGRVSRKQAEKAFDAANRKMRKRGILWDDLPAEVAGLREEFYTALKAGENERARDAVSQLEAVLSAVVVDAGFIDRKFGRLNALIRQKPAQDKQAVSNLLRKATQMVGDGKFAAANQELNRIFVLLSRS